jgi:hypothetical protein
VAAALVLLALVQPVATTGSDGAIQLLAAQAVADHGTLALDAYRDDARCAYDLASDYRVVSSPSGLRYFVVGPPLLSAPFVFMARRLGFDMLDQAQEFALANVLSAVLCGLSFLLLFALCRTLLDDPAALVLSVITTFGSPLVSTFATGLWPAAYALAPLLLATRHVTRHALGLTPWRFGRMALWLLVALSCRPASVFFWAGLLAYGLARLLERSTHTRQARPWRLGARGGKDPLWVRSDFHHGLLGLGLLLLGSALAVLLLASAGSGPRGLLSALPSYYSPLRLLPLTPWAEGMDGVLLSPGRGLLVYCPFLVVALLGLLLLLRRVWRQPLVWFCVVWAGTQIVATGLKAIWWGGSSFGPRQLAEVLVPAAVLTAWLWRTSAQPGVLTRWRSGCAYAYAGCGIVAALMHSGQGLWNPAVQAWNRGPGRTLDPSVLVDWRYPQFLATSASVRARDVELQMRNLQPLRPNDTIGPASPQAVFIDWHAVEGNLRRTGRRSWVRFEADGFDTEAVYALELRVATAREQALELSLGDWSERVSVTPPEPHTLRFLVPGRVLANGRHELALGAPGAARASERDARIVGLSVYALRFATSRACGQVYFYSEDCTLVGFADAEPTGRWTRAREAALRFDLEARDVPIGRRLRLALRALGPQTLSVRLNGMALATLALSGQQVEHFTLEAPTEMLRVGSNRLDLWLPDARPAPGDARLLGVWFQALESAPLEPGVRLTTFALGAAGALPAPADYDGDGLTDFAVLTAQGSFRARFSRDLRFAEQPLGRPGDRPLSRDYDGDGRADFAVWRPTTGELLVRASRDGVVRSERWGQAGDDPSISADYDGDGRADPAVYRASSTPAVWWIQRSRGGITILPWGLPGDRAVLCDIDGDGRNDPATLRVQGATNVLYARGSRGHQRSVRWGAPESEPALADYDGDGRTDVATWRPVDGAFAALLSSGGVLEGRLGLPGDVPVPADYDGDGRSELALWRPSAQRFQVLAFVRPEGSRPTAVRRVGQAHGGGHVPPTR